MKFKKFVLVALVIVMGLSIVGCQQEGTTATEPAVNEPPVTSETTEETEASTEVEIVVDGKVNYDALYAELKGKTDLDAYNFFQGLKDRGLTSDQILTFFLNLPLSDANESIYKVYMDDGLGLFTDDYPHGATYGDYVFKIGMGTEIDAPFTGNKEKLPLTEYVPIPAGTVGDPNKTYKIGAEVGNSRHPWAAALADSFLWAASQYSNVEVIYNEVAADATSYSEIIDSLIAQDVDVIVVHPARIAVGASTAQKAQEAGIPVVTVDLVTTYKEVKARVAGNFDANGTQVALKVIQQLAEEGSFEANMVMLRKPLGSTADAIRTGYFLKVLSYFPSIKHLQSYHDENLRTEALANVESALQAYPEIDIIYASGDHEAIVAYEAAVAANRLNSRKDGKKIIAFSLAGMIASISGIAISGQVNQITSTMGIGYELSGIAIAILGGIRMGGGRGTILGTLIGALTFQIMLNILTLSGLGTYAEQVLKGALLVIIVIIYCVMDERKARRRLD